MPYTLRRRVAGHGSAKERTTVRLRLDGQDGRLDRERITREIEVPHAVAGREKGPAILLIDGYQVLTDALHELLRGDGWQVRKAYDGKDGLRLAELLRPDIVFCDLELRGRPDADDVARILRERSEGWPLLLVGLTTMAWGGPEGAVPTGFDKVLQKPVDIEQIEAIVRQHG